LRNGSITPANGYAGPLPKGLLISIGCVAINHSPLFAPDVDPAMHTGIEAELAMLRDLFKNGVPPKEKTEVVSQAHGH
jgi:hypothetical protein